MPSRRRIVIRIEAGHLRSTAQAPRVTRPHKGALRARPARCDQARSAVHTGHRAGGHKVHRRHLQQRGGKPGLQALHPEPLSGATASSGRHASRLHPVAGRFRRRHQDELHRGRAELLRGLSCTAQRGQPGEMLELVSHGRPAARRRRTLADRRHHPPDHAATIRSIRSASTSAACRPAAAAAAIMGATYTDLYAAVGIHSGLACGAASDLPSAFVAMRQGGGPITRQFQVTGHLSRPLFFMAIATPRCIPTTAIRFSSSPSRTTSTQKKVLRGRVPGGHAYTRTILTDAGGRAIFEHWNIHGAGHAWSGGSPAGSYTDPRGPDATREMLRFFLEHSLPEE